LISVIEAIKQTQSLTQNWNKPDIEMHPNYAQLRDFKKQHSHIGKINSIKKSSGDGVHSMDDASKNR